MKKALRSLLSLLLIFAMLYSFGIIVFADNVQELSETAEEAVTYVSVEADYLKYTLQEYINTNQSSATFLSQECLLSTGESGYCYIGYSSQAKAFYIQVLDSNNFHQRWCYKYDQDYTWKHRTAYVSDVDSWENVEGFSIQLFYHSSGSPMRLENADSRCRLLFKEFGLEKNYSPIDSEDLFDLRNSYIQNDVSDLIMYEGFVNLSNDGPCNVNIGWSAGAACFYIQPLNNNPNGKWAYKFTNFNGTPSWAYRNVWSNNDFTLIDDFSIEFIDTATYDYLDCPSGVSSLFSLNQINPLQNGSYYFKNIENRDYLQLTYYENKYTMLLTVDPFAGNEYQQWHIEYVGNKYYKITSEESGLSLALDRYDTTQGYEDIVQESYYASPRQQWSIEITAQGNCIIRPRASEETGYDWCVGSVTEESGKYAYQVIYTSDSNYDDEWQILRVRTYGSQSYRDVTSTEINCHGYAMMRDDAPKNWTTLADYYVHSIEPNDAMGKDDYSSEIRETISSYTKIDFENWMDTNGYEYIYESSFTGNGDYISLAENQYRVVLRTGFHNYYKDNTIIFEAEYDYHFWYQTSDGRWANKHGKYSSSELLPINTTPFHNDSSGWALDLYQDNQCVNSYTGFYDGEIYCYIITID